MIKRIVLILLVLLMATTAFAQRTGPPYVLEEEDGSPTCYLPWKTKVTNASLTCNADGTASIDVTTGIYALDNDCSTNDRILSRSAGVWGCKDYANWNTAYTHSQDNTQAHSDYFLNTGDTSTGDNIFDGAVTINNSQADKDFRIGAVGAPNALFVDGTNGYVGINDYDNSAPLANLHLKSLQNTMQIFEQVGDGVIYGFGSAGGYFRIKYFGSLLGGSDSEFMRMGINVDINNGKKNIDFKYSGDTTANIFVLDAGLEEVKTLDNVPYTMGTGGDAKISYNNTDLILDPNVVGSGKVLIGATGDDTINAGAYEVAGVAGITDNTSYWLCTDATCTTTCQVTITSGLITGCP